MFSKTGGVHQISGGTCAVWPSIIKGAAESGHIRVDAVSKLNQIRSPATQKSSKVFGPLLCLYPQSKSRTPGHDDDHHHLHGFLLARVEESLLNNLVGGTDTRQRQRHRLEEYSESLSVNGSEKISERKKAKLANRSFPNNEQTHTSI